MKTLVLGHSLKHLWSQVTGGGVICTSQCLRFSTCETRVHILQQKPHFGTKRSEPTCSYDGQIFLVKIPCTLLLSFLGLPSSRSGNSGGASK